MHTSYKILTIDMLTSSDNKNSTVYPGLLKAGFCYFPKKLFLLMQKQVTVIESIAALATICIVTLLILANLAQTSHTETNIEPAASLRYASSKYVSVARAVTSGIMPRVPLSRDQMEDVRRELDRRRWWVAHVCETIDTKRSHRNASLTNMIIDTEHNVSWCPIYKAASSTWMNYFAVLKDTLTDVTIDLVRRNLTQVSDIVRQKFQQDADFNKTYKKMSRTKKFLIVRHPLERLLSAYRDKLEHMRNREYYYKRFGRRIVLKYRRSGNTTRLEPTFAEFLRFIVSEKYFDEHWTPYYRTCEPCTIHYDYILKFETLDRDQNFLIQDANLSGYLYEKDYPRNINPLGVTTRKILDEYTRGISQSLLDAVYKIYENDYKLFNYSSVV
ncbi:carbohydrate sulfotransferase 11-like isoform X1 [Temnothorax curvispinosus]|uniref:Carbohydrate sulfotransferase n=1 Tax=Temnothorax curvispinosus TaxID=300111 RepID=A0A6J1PX35_9HYME|nr:carbohydrate sulfotransferase 11-like isoform X1 [Temnothorax curvispinosus]